MSVCICIFDRELEKVVECLDNKEFKYKFLFDSDEKYKTIQDYNLNLLRDCLLFSGSNTIMKANRYKTKGVELEKAWGDLVNLIFKEERHIPIVNDYYDNPNIVLVLPTLFYDSTQRMGSNTITLAEPILNFIRDELVDRLIKDEAINAVIWENYTSDVYKDADPDRTFFKATQQRIRDRIKTEYKQEVLNTFHESFKFRLITYYTKLREYSLEDIMRKLDEMGYLDERFRNDIYIYEEEARRLLAKRLCAISFKNDIKVLVEEGIINSDRITYNLDV